MYSFGNMRSAENVTLQWLVDSAKVIFILQGQLRVLSLTVKAKVRDRCL